MVKRFERFLFTPKTSALPIISSLFSAYNFEEDNVDLMNLVQAVETMRLFIAQGNSPDYERYIDFVGQLDAFEKKPDQKTEFANTKEDVALLTDYLYRTYNKREIDETELSISSAVRKILSGPVEAGKALESDLGRFLSFDKTPVISYSKLFLLYAQTREEYEKIAQFIVESKKGFQIATVQDIEHDEELKTLKTLVQRVSKVDKAIKILRDELEKKYAVIFNVSANKVSAKYFTESSSMQSAVSKLKLLQTKTTTLIKNERLTNSKKDSKIGQTGKVTYKDTKEIVPKESQLKNDKLSPQLTKIISKVKIVKRQEPEQPVKEVDEIKDILADPAKTFDVKSLDAKQESDGKDLKEGDVVAEEGNEEVEEGNEEVEEGNKDEETIRRLKNY